MITNIILIALSLNGLFSTFNNIRSIEKESAPETMNDVKIYSPDRKDFEVSLLDYKVIRKGYSLEVTMNTKETIEKISSKSERVLLREYAISDYTSTCILENVCDNASILLEFISLNNRYGNITLFFAENNNSLFCSPYSYRDACVDAGINMSYSLEKVENNMHKNTNEIYSGKGIGASGRIYGTIQWEDNSDIVRPLFGIKVEVSIGGSVWKKHTYTDINGNYDITYSNIWYIGNGKPTIKIITEGDNVKITNSSNSAYSFSKTLSDNGTNRENFRFRRYEDFTVFLTLFQGIQLYANVASQQDNDYSISNCQVIYPANSGGDAYYQNGKIYVIETSGNSDFPSYTCWDLLGHEYAHHLQKCMGITFPLPFGHYYSETNMIDLLYSNININLENAKSYGLKLAWLDGWASYWSIIAQTHFPTMFKTFPHINDNFFSTANGYNNDLDEYRPSDSISYGDADLRVVECLLFKMGSTQTDQIDLIPLGHDFLIQYLNRIKPDNLSLFLQSFYIDFPLLKKDLGYLLESFGVLTAGVQFINISFNNPPTIMISTNKGSSHFRFNKFDLIFEDSFGDTIKAFPGITCNSATLSYTPSMNDWYTIRNNYGLYFFYRVYQTTYFETGGYHSPCYTLPL